MTASSLLFQEITRRLAGRCRINLQEGTSLSYAGLRGDALQGCLGCTEQCEHHADAEARLGVQIDIKTVWRDDRNAYQLTWACPGCGHPVNEDSSLLSLYDTAVGIESDPLCHSCRRKT